MRTEKNLRARAERFGTTYVSPYKDPLPSPPQLLEENRDAWALFSACSSQLIVGGLGVVVGIMHDTLYPKMDVREIPRTEWYEIEQKFIHLERLYVKRLNRDIGSKTDKQSG